jgi:signal transduction histidine kinase
MPRSLRSTLILASLLWTGGLLGLMHMASLLFIHFFPVVRGHETIVPILVSVVLMSLGVMGLRQGLAPFRRLREKLTAVRKGENRRVDGVYPNEVQPLIDELNALLEDREKAVKRAFATAGDLAHGLKTPLALLAQEADRAAADGHLELAGGIVHQVERMSRQVTYHLARARAAASGAAGAARCPVTPCADALVRTLTKLYVARGLTISSTVATEHCARVQREDLDEMLGNLLDNACKWANSKVVVDASRRGEVLVVTVDDDGPGLAHELRTLVLERGVRADEAAPGSGLGLAIVRDLSEVYGGSIALADSPLGGLRAQLSLPSC